MEEVLDKYALLICVNFFLAISISLGNSCKQIQMCVTVFGCKPI